MRGRGADEDEAAQAEGEGEVTPPPVAAPRRFADPPSPGGDATLTLAPAGRRLLEPPLPEPGGAPPHIPLPGLPDHYRVLGEIGRGGSGVVHLIEDLRLGRTLALKVLQPRWAGGPEAVARLEAEARLTAQLEHPGIVPVYDVGRLRDGRLYFTMKWVRGEELGQVIRAAHVGRVNLRRLVDVFRQLCQAVGYAHARGVIHRDLKPANVMVGAFGEVVVMDWGLARALEDEAPGEGRRRILGTPAFMAPEQARGLTGEIGPWTDVYALGAILWAALAGREPYEGASGEDALRRVALGGPPPPLPLTAPGPLRELVDWAMAPTPGGRPTDAGVLAREVERWLDGDRRAARAREVLAGAEALLPEMAHRLEEARALRRRARESVAGVPRWAPSERFEGAWALEDKAAALEAEVDLRDVAYVQGLRGALTHDADLPEAHRQLAARAQRLHAAAEAAGDDREAARQEILLREHDREGAFSAYLAGEGQLTLRTDPPGAWVTLYGWREVARRLQPELSGPLGRTPLDAVPLARGRHLLKVEAPGREAVWIPLYLERGGAWSGIPPEGGQSLPVPLPPLGSLGEGCYVPAGWFLAGGDRGTSFSPPRRRVWVDGFVLQRHPVTNAEYIAFLDDLCAHGRAAEAELHQPRERFLDGERGEPIYGRAPDGRFHLRPDAEGDAWLPDEPVTNIQWLAACAYARWRAVKEGLPWRLPGELEWEKAARGVDGRRYPWGEHLHPAWANVSHSREGRPLPAPVTAFPEDVGPYGARGMAGNVRDWCLERFKAGGPRVDDAGRYHPPLGEIAVAEAEEARLLAGEEVRRRERAVRGGAWIETRENLSLSERFGDNSGRRSGHTGFRLVRPWP